MVAATVVTSVGGVVQFSGEAGGLAGTTAELTVIPLSVTLAGALVTAAGFLRPLRHRAPAGPGELGAWAGRVAVLWLLGLLGLALAARQTFRISLGDSAVRDIADLFGVTPEVGFTTDVPSSLLLGLLWLAGVLALALLVSRAAPLPGRLERLREPARPAASAMVALLLAYVGLGLVVGLVVAGRGQPADTFAVLLLGLPNLAWLGLTLGLGATWDGRVEGPFALPVPPALDQVLRSSEVQALNVGTLAATTAGGGGWWPWRWSWWPRRRSGRRCARRPGRGCGGTPRTWPSPWRSPC
ncbi:hypothetical protein GCM10020295_06690 [Streptomyces cinereospinus]